MADSWLRPLGEGCTTFRPAVAVMCQIELKQVISRPYRVISRFLGVPESRNMLSLVPETGFGEVKPPSIIINHHQSSSSSSSSSSSLIH